MTVAWTDRAYDQLADIYVTATVTDREAIARAVERINARLATDPWFLGEARDDDRRVWFHHPLMVIYRVVTGGEVVVSHVARLRPWRAGADGNG
jgi:hypothetical protein